MKLTTLLFWGGVGAVAYFMLFKKKAVTAGGNTTQDLIEKVKYKLGSYLTDIRVEIDPKSGVTQVLAKYAGNPDYLLINAKDFQTAFVAADQLDVKMLSELTKDEKRLGEFTGNSVDKPCKEGWYNISEDITVVDAKMTSYSAEFWTDRLEINSDATSGWSRAFWLGDFGNNYLILGDPYIVQVPVNLMAAGNNSMCIGSGFNVTNATGGSPDSRLVYTIRFKGSVGYGKAFNSSEIARNDAISRLINKTKNYVNVSTDDIEITTEQVGGIQWLWGPSLFKTIVWEK